MKKFRNLLLASLLAPALLAGARDLVILHTNDTHSLIDPDEKGRGGVLQRKAIIDSIRRAEKNVVLIDAGDIVQGTLYFKFFRGDVEYPLMDMMGYDLRVLGNHEFDNGLQDLSHYYRNQKGKAISANYDFSATELKDVFAPYIIKKIDGKRVGFFGLNVDPASLISSSNIEGVKFLPIIETANRTATLLKKDKKCDLVVAVTHIGYTTKQLGKETDIDLARASKDIDIVIGGHSHTLLDPDGDGTLVDNAEGRPVLITQTGKNGHKIGYIKINLDNSASASGKDYDYKLLPVTDRFSTEQLDNHIISFLKPYRMIVDSVNNRVIGYAPRFMSSDDSNGEYANWTADFAYTTVNAMLDSLRHTIPDLPQRLDLAIMNVGGIRQDMPAGPVTEGKILSTFPFANRLTIMKIKGADLISTMRAAARRGGEAISSGVRVVMNPDNSLVRVVIDGREVDPDRDYYLTTIDYLAQGNDDLYDLAKGQRLWTDSEEICYPLLRYVEHNGKLGIPMQANPDGRFIKLHNP